MLNLKIFSSSKSVRRTVKLSEVGPIGSDERSASAVLHPTIQKRNSGRRTPRSPESDGYRRANLMIVKWSARECARTARQNACPKKSGKSDRVRQVRSPYFDGCAFELGHAKILNTAGVLKACCAGARPSRSFLNIASSCQAGQRTRTHLQSADGAHGGGGRHHGGPSRADRPSGFPRGCRARHSDRSAAPARIPGRGGAAPALSTGDLEDGWIPEPGERRGEIGRAA